MYDSRPVSNDAVSVTDDKNGKRPISALSVDMDEALKEGHATELARGIQFCAMAVEIPPASSARTNVVAPKSDAVFRLDRREECAREQFVRCGGEVVTAFIRPPSCPSYPYVPARS